MVSCLLLAAAAVLWPLRSRRRSPGGFGPKRLAAVARASGRQSSTDRWLVGGTQRAVVLAAAAGVLGLLHVMGGVVVLTAAAAVLATGTLLVRRSLADRRGRVALVDITAGLRMLGRELRAGAEPAVAAANAGAAARGAGAKVLRGLARLTRADDRSPVVAMSGARSAPSESGFDGIEAIGRGSAALLVDDPLAQVSARLRSGWLLTRRHGLAFTPLIDALAADLSEQIAAEAERAGQVAGPRMSGYVMAVLPLLGLALGVGMGADPFRVLLLTPVGNILLLVGVLLTCAGLLWSARIVRR